MNYIGKKGYTLYKNQYSDETIESIKKELMLKPQLPMKQFGNVGNTEFPVYRENTSKLYIPRFYGIDKLGTPDKSELSIGENIDLPFAKELCQHIYESCRFGFGWRNIRSSMRTREMSRNRHTHYYV